MELDTSHYLLNNEDIKRILQSRNLYTALQLTNSASDEDVEESFKHLVNKINPDNSFEHPEAKLALKVLETAYKTLKDPNTREDYDYLLQIIPADDLQPPQHRKKEPDTIPIDYTSQRMHYFKSGKDYLFDFRYKGTPVVIIIAPFVFVSLISLVLYAQPEYSCDRHYQVLGIRSSSNTKQIKNAYWKLLGKFHPDMKALQEDIEQFNQFQRIKAAYQVLSDYKKRMEFDMYCLREKKTDT